MTDDKTAKQRDRGARVWLALLTLVLTMLVGVWFSRTQIKKIYRLSAVWSGEQIHVSSLKDGPWLVTHLVVYQNGYWRAVAQLPAPVTIIDSRGHYFSREEIDKLKWIDFDGEKQAPPTVGEEIGVMYVVPNEGKRPPR